MSLLSVHALRGDGEVLVGTLSPGGRPGSIVDVSAGSRQAIVFHNRGTHSVVSRSIAGADINAAEVRMIHTIGFDELAVVAPEAPFELRVQTELMPGPATIRFTHEP